jgi:hypothetical protein
MSAFAQSQRVRAVAIAFRFIQDQFFTDIETMWRTSCYVVRESPDAPKCRDGLYFEQYMVSELFDLLSRGSNDESRLMCLNRDGRIDLGVTQLRDALVKPAQNRARRESQSIDVEDSGPCAPEDFVENLALVEAVQVLMTRTEGHVESKVASNLFRLAEGRLKATDLAKELGVSDATISRVRATLHQQLRDLLQR